jgi:asparagine synthase (glutamine-hydrolysing)
MCGIVGLFGPSCGDGRRALMARMSGRIRHRGPDGEGVFVDARAAIGHVRLAIIDVEGGAQPMHSRCQRYVLSFNGEIYNYLELRAELEALGECFATHSDTEVLLAMLVRYGSAALKRLNGMFALAFFDRLNGTWLLARDPFGIKPLYIAEVPDGLLFASEIKALWEHPHMQPRMQWSALQEYLTFQYCLVGRTLFAGVRQIMPGTYVRGLGHRIEQEAQYWRLSYEVDEARAADTYVEELSALLSDSARLQIRSDVPVGAYASGGIDSSVVACLAARQTGAPLPLFHGRFDAGNAYDESHWAQMVASAIGSPLELVTPSAQEFVDEMPRLIYMLDEPLAGPGLFPQAMVSRLAARFVKVVLGGQGGDELFGGYTRYLIGYLEQALKGAMYGTQEEGRHVVTLATVIENLPMLRGYEPLLQHFWRDGLFASMDARYFRLIDRGSDMDHLLTHDARARIDRDEVFAEFQLVFNDPQTRSYINKMTHFDQTTFLPALLQVEDRVSMAVSMEARVPLLDTRIAELVASMPPSIKFAHGTSKHVLKRAARALLPANIVERQDKMGFPVPLNEWLKGGPVRDFVRDVLLGTASRQRGLFRPEALATLVDHERPFGRQLWGALCLELWHQQFVDDAR